MSSLFKNRSRIFLLLFQMAATFAYPVGCAKPGGTKSEGEGEERRLATGSLSSAHSYLSVSDLENFRPGRSKDDVLGDVQWRGNFLMGCAHEGKTVCALAYTVLPDVPKSHRGEVAGKVVWAIFVDDTFAKFVLWQKGNIQQVPYGKTTRSRPKPVKVGDCSWLVQQMEREPADLADVQKEVKSPISSPEHIDPGLTTAYLLLRALGAAPGPPGTPTIEEDYKRNAELRDQFNASRLRIGMTESNVESVFNAKPLESGKTEAGIYHIFGSNECGNVPLSVSFRNILVLFRDGKLTWIASATPSCNWREELGDQFSDLPAPSRPGELKEKGDKSSIDDAQGNSRETILETLYITLNMDATNRNALLRPFPGRVLDKRAAFITLLDRRFRL